MYIYICIYIHIYLLYIQAEFHATRMKYVYGFGRGENEVRKGKPYSTMSDKQLRRVISNNCTHAHATRVYIALYRYARPNVNKNTHCAKLHSARAKRFRISYNSFILYKYIINTTIKNPNFALERSVKRTYPVHTH